MVDLTEGQQLAIRDWARPLLVVRAVILFGSRAKGKAHAESDVDLALEFDLPHDEVERVFLEHGEWWQADLRQRTGLPINLAHLAGSLTPLHTAYVAEASFELFRRF